MRMKVLSSIVFFLFIFAVSTMAAEEHLILFPVQTFPAIVERGKDFKIKLKGAHSDAKPVLLLMGNEYPLEIAGATADKGDTVLEVKTPDDMPFELFDLKVVSSKTEIQRHAVKIIPAYKKEYYFVHLTDPHFRRSDNSWSEKLAGEINLVNPEFVILTGDVISNGEDLCRALMRGKESYANYLGSTAQEELRGIIQGEIDSFFKFADLLDVPVFVVPGNHDTAGPLNPVCRNIWEDRFIYRYFSFNYGDDYFAGLDNSQMFEVAGMIYPEADKKAYQEFESDQLDWLEADLEAHESAALKTIFFHCPLFGVKSAIKGIIDKHRVSLVLIGHHHTDMAWREGLVPTLWLMTRTAPLGYRLIRVNNGGLASWGYAKSSADFRKKSEPLKISYSGDMKKAENPYSLDLYKLKVEYDGPNDGTRDGITARITNENEESFENARLKFVLKKGKYSVTGGIVSQVVDMGNSVTIYVAATIPAHRNIDIKVEKSN